MDYLKSLQKQYGEDKLLKIATWLKERDPDINNMWKTLRAIDTAAEDWTDMPVKKSSKNNRKEIFKMLGEEV